MMDILRNISKKELHESLINMFNKQGDDKNKVLDDKNNVLDDETFDTLWNKLSEKHSYYAKGTTVEISGKTSLATFLIDILEIHNDDDLEASGEEVSGEEVKGYDIEQEIDKSIYLKDNRSFRILWNALKEIPEITVTIEDYYIDRVYRDSYYTYYSCKHFAYSRYCKRLFMFSGKVETEHGCSILSVPEKELEKSFIGCIVIRPLETGKIGRSLLNPYYFTDVLNTFIRKATYNVTMFGKRLFVEAFPYSMQDEETTSCAEITILNLLDYFSEKYAEYKYFLPKEIIDIALKNGYERRLPTKGLDYLLISKVFMEAGFYPVLYNSNKLEDASKFKRILHYYIESGIPTAIGLEINKAAKHSIICIGHGGIRRDIMNRHQYSISDPSNSNQNIWLYDSADMVEDYIVMDDNEKPYARYTFKEGILGKCKPEYLMVPLYKRMFLEAADAYDICTSILADSELGIQKQVPKVGTKDNPVVIRLFMASARGFKKYRLNNFGEANYDIRERYINTPFPRFVWVCELYCKDEYPEKCIGEVIIDATSAPNVKMDSVILIHYSGVAFEQLPDRISDIHHPIFNKLTSWEKFEGYKGNLDEPSK